MLRSKGQKTKQNLPVHKRAIKIHHGYIRVKVCRFCDLKVAQILKKLEFIMINILNILFSGSGREEHPAGEYDYPFSFQLPQKLPSSFEGENGFIRYHLKVVIKKSWKKDLKLKKMFVVNEHIDINASNYDVAPGDEDQKTLGKSLTQAKILELI